MRMDHIAKTVTDTDGRFRLTGLKAGDSYQIEVKPSITAHDPAWQHQSPWMPKLPDNASGEVKLPDVKLIKLTQSLAGQVVDPDGKPVEGAQVSAMLHDGFQGVAATLLADRQPGRRPIKKADSNCSNCPMSHLSSWPTSMCTAKRVEQLSIPPG